MSAIYQYRRSPVPPGNLGAKKPPGDQSGLEVTKTASDSETILDWALIRLNPERETSNTSVSPFITRLFSFISCAI